MHPTLAAVLLEPRHAAHWLGQDPSADCIWLATSMRQAMRARLHGVHSAPGVPAVVALLATPVSTLAKPPLDWPAPWRSLCLTAALHCATREAGAPACDLVPLADAWLAPDTRIATTDRAQLERWLAGSRPTALTDPRGDRAVSVVRAILARHDAITAASGMASALAQPPSAMSTRRRA